jgi:hypothetical protein
MKNYISFNRTDVKLHNKIIYKKYKINTIPIKYIKCVNKNILSYHEHLKKNLVRIPKLIFHNKKLEFHFEYCGESLSEIVKKKNIPKNKINIILKGVSEILNKCERKKIDLDPHFKNFTIKNNQIFYVDLFPPMTNDYKKLLLNNNKNIKTYISEHFNMYSYKLIKHHFLADLKKTKNINQFFYFYSKKYFIDNKIIKKIDFKLIDKIILIEEKNLNNNNFTLS